MIQQVKLFFGVILLVISLVCLLQGISSYLSTNSFIDDSLQVQGKVDGVVSRGSVRYPIFSYVDYNTNRHTSSSVPNTWLSEFKQGDTVSLHMRRSNPENIMVDTFYHKWFSAFLYLTLAALSIGAGSLFMMSAIGRGIGGVLQKNPTAPRGSESVHHEHDREQQTSPSDPQPEAQDHSTDSSKNGDGPTIAEVQALARENLLFERVQQYVDDTTVSDIIVSNFRDVTIIKGGKTSPTKIEFDSQAQYQHFVERLLLAANVTYSTAKPIADGMIGSNIRIHAVNSVLCDQGPYLSIRVSRFPSIGFSDLSKYGLAPMPVFEYLKAVIQAGQSVLVAGPVGTGKTTLVRTLAASIPPEESILVIEDTPEVKIKHPNVRYVHTREANFAGKGEVHMGDCIRAGMRMAMSRIIVGEIRDAEAAEAFIDVCASGHPGLSTIHARSSFDALNRLELFLGRKQQGVQREVLKEQVATALQVLVFLKLCPATGKRRIVDVRELRPGQNGGVEHGEIFHYGVFDRHPGWKTISQTSFFEESLKDAHAGSPLSGLQPVFGLE